MVNINVEDKIYDTYKLRQDLDSVEKALVLPFLFLSFLDHSF